MTLVGRHRASPIPIVISLSVYISTRPSAGAKEGGANYNSACKSACTGFEIYDDSDP